MHNWKYWTKIVNILHFEHAYIGGTVHVIIETIPNWMAIMAYVKLNSEHFIPNDFLII